VPLVTVSNTKAVKYDIQRIVVLGWKWTALSTLNRKNSPKMCNLSIYPHLLIFTLFLMTSQRHFSFFFPEEMNGLIDFFCT